MCKEIMNRITSTVSVADPLNPVSPFTAKWRELAARGKGSLTGLKNCGINARKTANRCFRHSLCHRWRKENGRAGNSLIEENGDYSSQGYVRWKMGSLEVIILCT